MKIDFERRKSVMSRSVRLGHCVCNPKKPCPCDLFKTQSICQCAGEKVPVKSGDVALTKHVRKAGCASKIGQADLLRILGKLPPMTDPNVLVGTAAGDDAGVYRLSDELALVQTVDVFTPCVDDPTLFGRIAAANSVSDVYAMGGTPVTALSIVGFPIDELDGAVMEAMLLGALMTLDDAECRLLGGHSINDEEIKMGFAVTGTINPSAVVQRGRAQAGDDLVLTKPLGTGMVCFGSQIGRISTDALNEVGASMATLNKDAAQLMSAHDAHACTDITGYGLAGHLVEMARGSGVSVELDLERLPVFGVAGACLRHGILSGAIERNRDYAMAWIKADESAEAALPILYDPQTSGGLLVSLPPNQSAAYVDAMHQRGHHGTAIVGSVVRRHESHGPEGRVVILNDHLANFIGSDKDAVMPASAQAGQP